MTETITVALHPRDSTDLILTMGRDGWVVLHVQEMGYGDLKLVTYGRQTQ